jgi:hypothetical protein
MRIYGTVRDASTEKPIEGGRVSLLVGDGELAMLRTDERGKFDHREAAEYIGETLRCSVEKDGYESKVVTRDIEKDEVILEIELVPEEEKKIELKLSVKDEESIPLKGVGIALMLDGEAVSDGVTDKYGVCKFDLKKDFKNKAIRYRVQCEGFELATGELKFPTEASHEITLKRTVSPKNWRELLHKMVRASKLEVKFFEEVEKDSTATYQAFLVVLIVVVCVGIGSLGSIGAKGLIQGVIKGIIGWIIWSALIYVLGVKLLRHSSDFGELLRCLGFAYSPRALNILGIFPKIGGVVNIITSIWVLVAFVVAVREALDIKTGRAILVSAFGFIFFVIVNVILWK